MKSFIIVLLTSVIVFLIFRALLVLVYRVAKKAVRDTSVENPSVLLSSALLILYLHGFSASVEAVMKNYAITNLEWYLIYTVMGCSALLWCYFGWGFEKKAKIRFADDKQMAAKKIFVFSFVMLFVFYRGYRQLDAGFGGFLGDEEKDLMEITNITIVTGIIALDRVLNQVRNYVKCK